MSVRALPDRPVAPPTVEGLLAAWGEQLADPTVLTILRAALDGGRRGEVRLYFSNRGVAAKPPALYVNPDGTGAGA